MMTTQNKKVLSFVILGLFLFTTVFNAKGAIILESADNIDYDTEGNLTQEIPLNDDDKISSAINSRVVPIDYTGEEVIRPTDFIDEEVIEPNNYDSSEIEWLPIEDTLKNVQRDAETVEGSTTTVSYDVKTGVETISAEFTPQPESAQESINLVEPYAGLLGEMSPESIVNNPSGDQRTVISGQTSFPWRTIVKLYIKTPWGNYVGSGAIIDDFHVLTAGHCAYIRDSPNFGWATSIDVVPAMDTSDTFSEPYGRAKVTYMRSYSDWTSSGDWGDDWAVLTLDRNVGSYTGWMGRITAGSGNSIYTGIANVAGYPTDVASGNRLAFDANDGHSATTNKHYYWADTGGGESGGPVWRYVSGNRYIMTTHAYGAADDGNPIYPNSGTRLNSNKYNKIFDWLGADSAPTDKADLVDRGLTYSSYTPNPVTQGVTSFTVSCDIRNIGTASSGGFYVYYYASTNSIISSGDYFIGMDYVSSISPFNYRASSWTGIFPASIPAGNYYIGWIIDAPGWVTEFDETNNKEHESAQLTVNPAPPPPGYIEVQVNDALTSDPVDFAYIQVWDDTSALVRAAYTNSTGFFNITAMDVGTFNVTASRPGYHNQKQLLTITGARDDYYLTFGLDPYPPDSGYIEVHVNESRTLQPIENAYLRIYNYSSGELFSAGYTDSSGFYNVTGLYIGWWTINVTYPGFGEQKKIDYINWNGDDDYLQYYMDLKFQRIVGSVALFRDNLPWSVNSTEPILAKYNISYTVYNSSDFGSVNLSQYQKVIIASEQVQSFYDRLEGNVTWFEDYAANGGVLELHAVDRKGNYHNGTWNAYLYPGGLNKTYNVEFVDNSINMPAHPFILKPFLLNESQVDGWIGGEFTVYPTESREILLGPNSDPILLEIPFGTGFIIASTQTLEWNANYGGTQQLFENLILYDPLSNHYTINVTAPLNSNSWEVNQSYHITWDSTDNIADVEIDLYRGGTFVMEIVGNTTNDGDFLWSVPDLIDSTQYQIKVIDIAYSLTFDYGEMFEIFNPYINVTAPLNSNSWEVNQPYHITWYTTDSVADEVKIELYRGGAFVTEIVANTTNDGDFLWSVPDLIDSTQYQIKVIDTAYSLTFDYSEMFEIFNPSINVINPIGTSIWITGTSEYINWTSLGTITHVEIELFLEGTLELEISTTTTNDGVYLWVLPSNLTTSSEYSIKITDVSTSVTYDFSVNFEIRAPPGGGIPGFDLLISCSLLVGVTLLIIRRKKKKLSIR